MTKRIVVVGAGIGGLTTTTLLARRGLDVTVLEAHVYPGRYAGTFYHQGFRFDAGATLAAGFDADGGMTQLGQALGVTWPVASADRDPRSPAGREPGHTFGWIQKHGRPSGWPRSALRPAVLALAGGDR